MKLLSWNVNGIRACLQKGFYDFLEQENPDILCIQETKMQEGQAEINTPGYYQYSNSAVKKGYSGVMIFTKEKPITVTKGIGLEEFDQEGRVLCAKYPNFYLVTCYTPNSQNELKRIEYRMAWEDAFQTYIQNLEKELPVIICGDLNVAHQEIDLKNPKNNRKNPGFSDQEREKMTQFLDKGFIDTFRYFYPDKTDSYSWWSYRFSARAKNAGWRIDYFLVSQSLEKHMKDARILSEVYGSDHCPVELQLR